MKWKKKLTKKEWNHVKETTIRNTLREIQRNLEAQEETGIVCFECRNIARKLGIEKGEKI